jgi:transposase
MPKKYVVTLTAAEREQLSSLVTKGKAAARTLTHARILLKADQTPGAPAWPDELIKETLDVGLCTVMRLRERFVEEGLEAALRPRRPSPPPPRKLDGHLEAQLIHLACSEAPAGRARWTLRLLADRMVELEYVAELSHETVRRTLKKRGQALADQGVVPPAHR